MAEFKDRKLPHKDYYVADTSEDQIFLCVNHDQSQSHLYISDVQGQFRDKMTNFLKGVLILWNRDSISEGSGNVFKFYHIS